MAINVSDNNPRINYTATSGQTVFTVPFEFFASTDLTVYVGGSVLATSAYTVTGGSGSTGSITTSSGQTAGAEIAIVRDVPLERTTDLTSSYSASSLNDQLDRIVTQVADLDDRVSRSISLNDYEVGVSLDLPAKASRLGKTVQFNSTTGALEIGPSGNELTSIASIASEITSLNGIKANITTVAGAISNVNSVGSNISSVTSVASSISNVNTVNTNIANVNSVATSITDVNDVADSIDQVELVAGSISNVDIVGPAIANVNTVAGNISNINTVAAISANVTTVAGITAAISTVNSNATNINLAATNIDDVNDVANVITKVTTVADNIANVNTVAPSVSYLSTVANNISNINTLAPISADITTVAGVASSVSGAAANAAAAEAAKVAAQAAQAAAELAADNFDDTYLGAKASDPTLDNDGDSLGNGDLYFNTTDGTLKVYNNSAWQAAALDASGFVDVTGDSMTGNLLFGDGNSARFGTHGDLTLVHETNNSYIIASNSKPFTIRSDDTYFRDNANSNLYMDMISSGGVDYRVRLYHSGTDVRLETTSTGIDINGNATFGDNDKAIFGAGSDLQIYHDGANSYIQDAGTGALGLFGSTFVGLYETGSGDKMVIANGGSDVELYYDNALKLATTATGIDVTGTVTADGLTVDGTAVEVASINSTQNGAQINFDSASTSVDWSVGISNSADGDFLIYQSGSGSGDINFYTGGAKRQEINRNGDISFYEDTGTTAKFFWDASAESLGIGTSSPSSILHLSSAQATVRTIAESTNASGYVGYRAANGTGYWEMQIDGANQGLRWLDDGTERMRIDSSGNLLVGKTSLGFATDGFEARASGQIYITDTTATPLVVRRNSTDGDIVNFYKDGATVGSIGISYGDRINVGTGNTGIMFRTSSRSIDPADPSTGLITDNLISLGRSGVTYKDLHLSGTGYVGTSLGIGTSDPVENLTVGATTTAAGFSLGSATTQAYLRYNNYFSGTSQVSDATKGSASISLGRSSDGVITFNTAAAGAGTPTEAARFDNSGNLLVGTTSSTGGGRLELKGSGTGAYVPTGYNGNNVNSVRIVSGGSPSTSDTVGISMGIGGGAEGYFGIVQDSSGYANFVFNSYNGSYAERMRISSGGDVGIGCSPASGVRLDIRSNATTTLGDFRNASATGFGLYVAAGDTSSQYAFRAADYQNNALFSVMGDGNVGIGEGSPSTYGKLVVRDGKISLVTDTASSRRISFWSTANGNSENAYIQSQNDGATTNTGEISFATKNASGTLAERMQLDASGNLLVGKTSSSFSTAGIELQSDAELVVTRNGSTASFNRLSDGNIVDFYKSGVAVGSIGVAQSGDRTYFAGGTYGIAADTSETTIMPCGTTGTGNDGVVNLGKADARFKDLYLSGGVYLGGTGAAHKLDDYEEGTWTPFIAGVTPADITGCFTKIGDLCYIGGFVNFGSTSDTTPIRIDNFPFTCSSDNDARAGLCISYSTRTTFTSILMNNATSTANLRNLGGTIPTNADFSGKVIHFGGVYKTA